jgi:hypothetical protein
VDISGVFYPNQWISYVIHLSDEYGISTTDFNPIFLPLNFDLKNRLFFGDPKSSFVRG